MRGLTTKTAEMLTGKAMDVDRELSQAAQNNERAGAIWAKRWLESERTNIVAAARLAEQRTDLSAVRLARSLGDHLMNLGFMDDTEFVFQAAARVGDALGDIEAHALGLLGCGKVRDSPHDIRPHGRTSPTRTRCQLRSGTRPWLPMPSTTLGKSNALPATSPWRSHNMKNASGSARPPVTGAARPTHWVG